MPSKRNDNTKTKVRINKASDVIGRSFVIHSANLAESVHGDCEHYYYLAVIFEDTGSVEKVIVGGYAAVQALDRYLATYVRERTPLTIIEKDTPSGKVMHQLWVTDRLDNN